MYLTPISFASLWCQAWSFCNEGECGAAGAQQFRNTSYAFDGIVSQMHRSPFFTMWRN